MNQRTLRRACVYCGSSSGRDPRYADAARTLGAELVRRGIGLVYGGGNIGLMGIVADAVLNAGGEVIGVIPEALAAKEVAHLGLTELHVVPSMHARKAMMAELSDCFIAMPGGFGTLEEIAEVTTWTQLGLQTKPCGLLNVAGYYDPLIRFFDDAVVAGFIRSQHRAIVVTSDDPAELLDRLSTRELPDTTKWIREEET